MHQYTQAKCAFQNLVQIKAGTLSILLQVEPLFLEAERKNKLLRSVAGGGVEQLAELRTRWDKFEIMMESHQLIIKDQVGVGG